MNHSADDLLTTTRASIARYGLLAHGETMVVAASGGPDSTALLHLLAGLRAEYDLTLVAAHLNHGFRGAEADADADYVAALCRNLGVDCVLEKVDVPEVRRRRHLSAQEAAREVRHAFLRRVALEMGANKIALGHTADDRVETILINLLRGTGADGLDGFPPVALPLIRPLYAGTRDQVMRYCSTHGLEPRHDSSNNKYDYLRNRIRAELLPHLRSYYNEKVDASILRMAELVSADNAALDELSAVFLRESSQAVSADELLIPRRALLELPSALQRRAVRQAIAGIRGHLQGATFEMVEGVVSAAARGDRHAITLPASGDTTVRVIVDPDAVRIKRSAPAAMPVPWQQEVALSGETRLEAAGIGLRAERGNAQAKSIILDSGAYPGERIAYDNLKPMSFRLRDIALPLMARSCRPGDRIQLNRAGGTKKLQDLFVDRKIPIGERRRCPVLCAADGTILAVIGVAVASIALRMDEMPAVQQRAHIVNEREADEQEADGYTVEKCATATAATDTFRAEESMATEDRAQILTLFPFRLPIR